MAERGNKQVWQKTRSQQDLPADAYEVIGRRQTNGLKVPVSRHEPPAVYVDQSAVTAHEGHEVHNCNRKRGAAGTTTCFRCGHSFVEHSLTSKCICRICNNDEDQGHPDRECPRLYATLAFWNQVLGSSDTGAYRIPKGNQIKPSPQEQVHLKTLDGTGYWVDFPSPRPNREVRLPRGIQAIQPYFATAKRGMSSKTTKRKRDDGEESRTKRRKRHDDDTADDTADDTSDDAAAELAFKDRKIKELQKAVETGQEAFDDSMAVIDRQGGKIESLKQEIKALRAENRQLRHSQLEFKERHAPSNMYTFKGNKAVDSRTEATKLRQRYRKARLSVDTSSDEREDIQPSLRKKKHAKEAEYSSGYDSPLPAKTRHRKEAEPQHTKKKRSLKDRITRDETSKKVKKNKKEKTKKIDKIDKTDESMEDAEDGHSRASEEREGGYTAPPGVDRYDVDDSEYYR
ncbi:hypothetical protein HBH69_062270 [Parastagonospora nodorum]|nr:hypothetical protein HBI06_039060 [Parastagonospora nodorum]KAH4239066.1 hypothetical protein HBI05_122040 [Parastagonospora nodorum]KAH5158316.1 hypothetical protein HBH69_062270 [Parastagonospora nodorum]KAH5279202.1 hypothetical protein HBI71_018680 [Parastagonospora nodorum]KAH5336279.1 hypothetical protein HBI12_026820 [Parastagonospora nodorum]